MTRDRGLDKGYKLAVVYVDGHQWVHKVDYRKEALELTRDALNDPTVAAVLVSNMNAHAEHLVRNRPTFVPDQGRDRSRTRTPSHGPGLSDRDLDEAHDRNLGVDP